MRRFRNRLRGLPRPRGGARGARRHVGVCAARPRPSCVARRLLVRLCRAPPAWRALRGHRRPPGRRPGFSRFEDAGRPPPSPRFPSAWSSRYFPASSVGASVSTYSDPQSHAGASPVRVRHRHTGHSLRRRLVQGPGFPRAHQTPDRQPRGRSKHFEKRDVDRPHDPPVEAAARRQDPEQFRAGTRDPHDDVGVRLGHPPPVVTRQQAEDRRLVVRMDAERPAVRPLPQTTRRTLPRTKLLRQLRKHRARAAFRGEVNVGIAWSPNSGRRG